MSDRSSNPLGIPRAILSAARRAGLTYPSWYVGGRETGPREKTFEDIVRDAKSREEAP